MMKKSMYRSVSSTASHSTFRNRFACIEDEWVSLDAKSVCS